MKEVWERIKDERYDVSSKGNIRSHRYMKNLRHQINNCGYARIALGSTKNRKFVHRLVAEYFCEKSLSRDVVNHVDGNKLNNSSGNLEWTTRSENDLHKFRIGLALASKCQDSSRAKLSNEQVLKVCTMLNTGIACTHIAIEFKVKRKTISDIKLGKTWNSLTNGILQTSKKLKRMD